MRAMRPFLLCCVVSLAGCITSGVTAINPLTGEKRAFESEGEVPSGWIVCATEETCPATRSCEELDEASCLVRTDCSPVYVGIGAYPPECDGPTPPDICDGESFAGCVDAVETCGADACGPAPGGATWLCPDGSVGGVTGRCIRTDSGTCGWETRACPTPVDECSVDECGPAPEAPSYICADGTIGGNTGRCLRSADGMCGWEIRDCPTGCVSPLCLVACPPGYTNPVDENGCVNSCQCVKAECTPEECGPAPLSPNYECPDGSIGGPTGECTRNAEGTCGWGWHECPPEECPSGQCGPQLGLPNYLCPDGTTTAGPTGRCLSNADGTCGWEVIECPDACASVPQCEFQCPPGTHNPVDAAGCEHTCDCVPDESAAG